MARLALLHGSSARARSVAPRAALAVGLVGLALAPGESAAQPKSAPQNHGPTKGGAAKPAAPAHRTAQRPAPAAPPGYAGAVRGWHTPAAGKSAPVDESGRPMLVLYALNTNERVEIKALSDRGGFSASDLDRAAKLLREPGSGSEHPVEPRTLDLVYRLQSHFKAQEIRVISGYRAPRGGHSNHGKGRAIDLVVPGTSDEDVAKFARDQGFVGVGVYPVSGFVHVDVRDRSYFWVDASGPGKRNRERGILGDLAQRSDAAALARGERPIAPYALSFDVEGALGHKGSPGAPTPSPSEEDDTTEGDGM